VPTVILLDEYRVPLRHSIQQNDARAVAEIEAMKRAIDPDAYFARTGGSINQQLVAPKLRWLARHEPDCFARAKTVLGSYDYITARLTGSLSVERNWALEAGFLDLAKGDLDEELVRLGGITPAHLPPLRASHDLVGEVTGQAAAETGLAAGTPVVAGCADHIASAFVAGAAQDGDLVVKYGGAGDIMLSCSAPRTDPRLFIDHHIVPGLFFTNGCMAASGSVLNWIVANFAKAEAGAAKAAGTSVHADLDRQVAELPPGAGGVVLLPYFLGEKTPLHDPHARGTLVGLGLHHELCHVWRAALESVAFGFRHHADVFDEMGLQVRRVMACDGGAASDLWLQITADVLERPIERLLHHPGSSLGAAFVAGMGAGALDDWAAITAYVQPDRVFEPDAARVAAYREAYGIYRDLYERLRTLYPELGRLPSG
jgi:xylulokinase